MNLPKNDLVFLFTYLSRLSVSVETHRDESDFVDKSKIQWCMIIGHTITITQVFDRDCDSHSKYMIESVSIGV